MAKLKDLEIDDYLKDCVDLKPEFINEEYGRMSGDFAYWNEKFSAANRGLLQAEWREEKVQAQLYLAKKEAPEGKKPPTEAAVDAMVKTDPAYEQAHLDVISLQAERDYLKGILETLRTKREMLVSAGAQLREEMKGDPLIRDRVNTDRVAREGF